MLEDRIYLFPEFLSNYDLSNIYNYAIRSTTQLKLSKCCFFRKNIRKEVFFSFWNDSPLSSCKFLTSLGLVSIEYCVCPNLLLSNIVVILSTSSVITITLLWYLLTNY